jgi:hypothetical protein
MTPDAMTPDAGKQPTLVDDSSQRETGMTAAEAALIRRLDNIVAIQKEKRPWYREGSLLVAIAAFFISFMTLLSG